MNINTPQRQALIAALNAELDRVETARKNDADDSPGKWTNAREANARRLDKERDELWALRDVLSKPTGQIAW